MEHKIQSISTANGRIYFWFDENLINSKKYKEFKQNAERKAVSEMLKELYPNTELYRIENGAPVIKNSRYAHISISHYKGWFSIFLSNECCGVDIQVFKPSLEKGKHYFLNSNEENMDFSLEELQLIWCAKEAFYKFKRGAIEDLKNEVSIFKIDHFEHEIFLNHTGIIYRLNYQQNEKLFLVWI